jgi:signal transduction histidine kinase
MIDREVDAQSTEIAHHEQLAALDDAIAAIASELSVERVLQLIVDRVRDLVDAEYAALGIIGPSDGIEQFITSGISAEQRAAIGALPRGHGLLGLIIREGRSFRIDDIATDSRRYGFPPNHPKMHAFLGAPVRSRGRTIGNLYLTNKTTAPTFIEDDLETVERFALHAGIAIENARLHEEVQRLAIVDERQRISQDLHDSIIQSLYGISLSLEDLPDVMAEDASAGVARIERAIDSIHATIRDLRNVIMGLETDHLDEADLVARVESLAAEFSANTMIDLEVTISTLPSLPSEHAAHLLSITREGLSNVARHSGATRAWLSVDESDEVVRLVIRDNGRGFDTEAPRAVDRHGLGNLQARAEAAGGLLKIESDVGAGTELTAEIPTTEKT